PIPFSTSYRGLPGHPKLELDNHSGASTNGKEFRGGEVGCQEESGRPIDFGRGGLRGIQGKLVVQEGQAGVQVRSMIDTQHTRSRAVERRGPDSIIGIVRESLTYRALSGRSYFRCRFGGVVRSRSGWCAWAQSTNSQRSAKWRLHFC